MGFRYGYTLTTGYLKVRFPYFSGSQLGQFLWKLPGELRLQTAANWRT